MADGGQELVKLLTGLLSSPRPNKPIGHSSAHTAAIIHAALPPQIDSLSDAEVARHLIDHQRTAKNDFVQLDQKLAESTATLTNLVHNTQHHLSTIKSDTLAVHERFLKFEDELIDYCHSTEPLSRPDQHPPPQPGLLAPLRAQISWLNDLNRLKLWFKILADFRLRTSSLAHQATQADLDLTQLEPVANQLCQLVEAYQQLRTIGQSNQSRDLYLLESIRLIIQQSAQSLVELVSNNLAKVLEEELQWPVPQLGPLDFTSPSVTRILSCFKTAAAFQKSLERRPDLLKWGAEEPQRSEDTQAVWVPIHEGSIIIRSIVWPITLRFRFHFDTNRTTNRLDKPEWYFTHILDRIAEHERFLRSDAQRLFEKCGLGATDVFHSFAAQLVRLAETKLKRSVPAIIDLKPILAHTIEEAVEFDRVVRERSYLRHEGRGKKNKLPEWPGTVEVILGNEAWFDAWFEAERRFTEETCLEIISSSETWEIESDDQRPPQMPLHATVSALRIQEVVEQVQRKYERLPRLACQAKFLGTIQVAVLDTYLQRIGGVLDGFERSGLIKVVGGDAGRANMGASGLERLVKIHISCSWMVHAVRVWNDDLFYAELYEKLKADPLMRSMTEVERLVKAAEMIRQSGGDGALFSAIERRFEGLLGRAEKMIVRQVVQEVLGELKVYFAKRWDGEAEGSDGASEQELELSSELVSGMRVWRRSVGLLGQTIRPAVKLNKMLRAIGSEIEEQWMAKIIMGPALRAISEHGGRQLAFDVRAGWTDGVGTAAQAFRRLSDACSLLSLPSSVGHRQEEPKEVGIAHAVRMCFDGEVGDEEFERFRKSVGVLKLSKVECQNVLRRRPECWR